MILSLFVHEFLKLFLHPKNVIFKILIPLKFMIDFFDVLLELDLPVVGLLELFPEAIKFSPQV
jgi:hypothetical protein